MTKTIYFNLFNKIFYIHKCNKTVKGQAFYFFLSNETGISFWNVMWIVSCLFRAVAEWLAPPETQFLLDFVRPDFLLLRVRLNNSYKEISQKTIPVALLDYSYILSSQLCAQCFLQSINQKLLWNVYVPVIAQFPNDVTKTHEYWSVIHPGFWRTNYSPQWLVAIGRRCRICAWRFSHVR